MKIFISIFLALVFAFSVFAQKQMQVSVTSTFLRKEPNQTAEKVETVQKGDRLTLEKKQDVKGWYYVSVKNGTVKGWIRKDTIEAAAADETVDKKTERDVPVVTAPPPSSPAPSAKPIPKETPAATPTASVAPPIITTATPAPTPILPTATPVTETMTAPTETTPTTKSAPTPIASPSPTPAATPDEEQEVIRVDSEEVNINVRVVDASNRAVKNLDGAQFKVYEDGVLQTITSVSATEAPMINALVIDNSRSLRSQLKSIIEAGKTIIGTNRAADETAVIRFVGADKIEVVRDFTANKTMLGDALDNMFVEGGQTAIIDAVYLSAKKIDERRNSAGKDDIRLRALILVSDGDDRASTHNEAELFDLLRASQVQIYTVGFVNNLNADAATTANRREKAKSFLNRLSEETGGRAFFPNSIDELPQIAADISAELHAQYLISYEPTNNARDGNFRRLKVEIDAGANKEKRFAITRAGRVSAQK